MQLVLERSPSDRAATGGWFRIGDGFIEVASDYIPLVEAVEAWYGECRVPEPEPGMPFVRCRAGVLPGSSLLLLTLEGSPVGGDAVSVAQALFQPMRVRQCYVEKESSIPGWRFLVDAERGGRLFLASSGHTALIDVEEVPHDFLVDYLVWAVQRIQPSVQFLHGASFGIGRRGGLAVGWSKTGKSTVALSLAERGHTFLGDDVAAIRRKTGELIPVRRSAGLRDGPLAQAIASQVEDCGYTTEVTPDGLTRKLVQVGDLFPSAPAQPLPLRAVFFLDGFADEPELTPYEATLADVERLRCTMLSWEPTAGRQLMRFVAIVDLLSHAQCYLLKCGTPEATAETIEGVMENL